MPLVAECCVGHYRNKKGHEIVAQMGHELEIYQGHKPVKIYIPQFPVTSTTPF